jgi:hypothetical protein
MRVILGDDLLDESLFTFAGHELFDKKQPSRRPARPMIKKIPTHKGHPIISTSPEINSRTSAISNSTRKTLSIFIASDFI